METEKQNINNTKWTLHHYEKKSLLENCQLIFLVSNESTLD